MRGGRCGPTASHRGGTLTVVNDFLPAIDPA
jgi:hypothetical protein